MSSPAALLQEQWELLAVRLSQTQQQIRACDTAMVFAFVEVTMETTQHLTLCAKHHTTQHVCVEYFEGTRGAQVCLRNSGFLV